MIKNSILSTNKSLCDVEYSKISQIKIEIDDSIQRIGNNNRLGWLHHGGPWLSKAVFCVTNMSVGE